MTEQVTKRNRVDRRGRPTPIFSRYSLFGKRQGFRRGGEAVGSYVDRYGPRMMALLIAIIGLCILDALFTLLYIQRGGGELNPLMDAAIDAGVFPFLALKCGLTLVGMAFLCLHKNFRFVKAILTGVLLLYIALFGYHVYLSTMAA